MENKLIWWIQNPKKSIVIYCPKNDLNLRTKTEQMQQYGTYMHSFFEWDSVQWFNFRFYAQISTYTVDMAVPAPYTVQKDDSTTNLIFAQQLKCDISQLHT